MKLQNRHYFSLFWVLFFLVIIVTSLGYSYKARLIPLVVSIPCFIFAVYRFYVELRTKEEESATAEGGHKSKKEKIDPVVRRKRFIRIILWILFFLALIFAVGFLYAIPIFVLSYMRANKESWALSVLCAGGMTAAIYLAFIVGTRSTLYEGIFIPLIRQALQQ